MSNKKASLASLVRAYIARARGPRTFSQIRAACGNPPVNELGSTLWRLSRAGHIARDVFEMNDGSEGYAYSRAA